MSSSLHYCGSCGAPIKIDKSFNKIICSFCNNEILITKTVNISSCDFKGGEKELAKLNNLLILLENAQESQNYKEGLEYCNKALEIDPTNSKLWEYKAVSYFWSINNKITKSDIDQVYTFLKNSKKYKGQNDFDDTFKLLANNLYSSVYHAYIKLDYDKSLSGKVWDSFSETSINFIIDFIKTMEICFDLYPDKKYLDASVSELSGYNKLKWIINEEGFLKISAWVKSYNFDPIEVRDRQINLIKDVNHDYVIPEVYKNIVPPLTSSNSKCFIATVCYENPNHTDLIILRRFRDQVLFKSRIGQKFILSYYKYGPAISSFTHKYKLIKLLMLKLILRPFVLIIKSVYITVNKN